MSNDKSYLNQYCQKRHIPLPIYNHQQSSDGFSCTATIEDALYTSLSAHSTKKEAEKDAARVAVQAVIRNHPTAKDFEDVLKSVEDISLSEPVKKPTSQPLTSTGGSVVNGVYYPINVTPPPGFPGSLPRPPAVKRADIPMSVDGPSIEHTPPTLNKPSGAVPVTPPSAVPVTPPTSKPNGPPPLISVPMSTRPPARFDKDIQDLEFYCRVHGLPSPVYTIYQERGRHVGRVKIGGMEFGRGWGYESFDDAKDSAAVVAIAGLAMTQARLLAQQGPVPRGGTPVVSAVKVPAQQLASKHSPHSGSQPSPLTQRPPLTQGPPLVQLAVLPHPHSPPTQPLHPHNSPTRLPHPHNPPTQPLRPHNPPTQPLHPTQQPPLTQLAALPHPHTLPTQIISLQTPSDFLPPIARGSTQPPDVPQAMAANYKGILNTYCQRNHYPSPTYECDASQDAVGYVSTVTVNGMKYKSSVHGSKKAADGDAAKIAVGVLGLSGEQESTGVPSTPPAAAVVTTSSTAASPSNTFVSYKNLLQEKAQKEKQSNPQYSTERREEGFLSTVTVYLPNNQTFRVISSAHPVKKAAEQEAAKLACQQLKMI